LTFIVPPPQMPESIAAKERCAILRGVIRAFLLSCAFVLLPIPAVPVLAAPDEAGAIAFFRPDARDGGEAELVDGVWLARGEGWEASLALLDDEERADLLEERVGSRTDPFATPPRRVDGGGFLSFRVEVTNRGEQPVLVQPHRCRLVVPGKDVLFPLDRMAMESAYTLREQEIPAAYRRAAEALFDRERTIGPGERLVGLLVYHGLPERTRKFRVDIELTGYDGSGEEFSAPYRRLSRREARDGTR